MDNPTIPLEDLRHAKVRIRRHGDLWTVTATREDTEFIAPGTFRRHSRTLTTLTTDSRDTAREYKRFLRLGIQHVQSSNGSQDCNSG